MAKLVAVEQCLVQYEIKVKAEFRIILAQVKPCFMGDVRKCYESRLGTGNFKSRLSAKLMLQVIPILVSIDISREKESYSKNDHAFGVMQCSELIGETGGSELIENGMDDDEPDENQISEKYTLNYY